MKKSKAGVDRSTRRWTLARQTVEVQANLLAGSKVFPRKLKKKKNKKRTHSTCDFERTVRDEALDDAADFLIIQQDRESQLFVAQSDYQASLVVAAAADVDLENCENT